VIVGRITRRLSPTRDGTIGVLATGSASWSASATRSPSPWTDET
jgi:hypothetical protein